MINFFTRNLDSFIVSTIFLILGFLPTIFDSSKAKNINISFENSNIDNSSIGNTYNQNTYNQNFTEHNYNTNTVIMSSTSTTSDDSWHLIILGILFFMALIFFYKIVGKMLAYSITISITFLILSIFMYKNLIKISRYATLPDNTLKISIRNIICWLLMFINYIIIFYKISFSSIMSSFMNLINSHGISIFKVIRFISDNPYEGFTAAFIAINIVFSIILIFKLFVSYIWIITCVKISINPKNRIWSKIYNRLNKKESSIDKDFWKWSFIPLFLLSTGLLAYAFSILIKLTEHQKI